MAKIKSIFDGGTGKLGNLVLYKRNGINVIRVKPDRIKYSKTPKQEAQRERFKMINNFLGEFTEPIRMSFTPGVLGRTAFQEAQSYNLLHGLAGEYPDIYVDKNKVLLSQGPLPLPARAWLTIHPEGFMVQWENGPEMTGRTPFDLLAVFILKKGWYRQTPVH